MVNNIRQVVDTDILHFKHKNYLKKRLIFVFRCQISYLIFYYNQPRHPNNRASVTNCNVSNHGTNIAAHDNMQIEHLVAN